VQRLSLTTRAFLFSFLPVCLVLGASFLALSAAIHQKVKQELRQSLQSSDVLLNRASAEYLRITTALLSKLTDSAGLKAAVGLLAEAHGDASAVRQVRRTIEAQLRDLQSSSMYDFLAVSNLRGETVAAVVSPGPAELGSLPALPLRPGLAEIQGVLFQLEVVPITIQGETAAVLTIGTRFELNQLPLAGEAVLLHGDKVVRSTFPSQLSTAIEQQVKDRCTAWDGGCEALLGQETFVISQLERAQLGDGYRLLGFRSLDNRLREFNAAFLRILVEVGGAGILVALLCTVITARSVSQPLRHLVAQLRRSDAAGCMPEQLTVGNGVHELDSLANAFNRVADTERRSRRELEVAKDAAESANRLKTEFLTNVSHELRTPINGVLGMTDLLLETTLDREQQEYASIVQQSAHDLTSIINDILDFSKLETGKLSLELAPFDLRDLMVQVATEVRTQAAQKGIEVDLLYPTSAPRMFYGDRTRICQVLMHLGGNAVKFTDRGRIRVSLECTSHTGNSTAVKLALEDTGIGIAPEMHDFIFEKFTQADGSLTRPRGGTGLGLAIAKQTVELMGGEIGVDSRVNAGSKFWFTLTLPRAEAAFESEPLVAGAMESLQC
jgi:signal transduction histidine kinase